MRRQVTAIAVSKISSALTMMTESMVMMAITISKVALVMMCFVAMAVMTCLRVALVPIS